jgi:hypothetical protein
MPIKLLSNGKTVTLRSFPRAEDFPAEERAATMDAFNRLIGMNWDVSEPHWTPTHSPFRSGYGLVLVLSDKELVGFSIYQFFDMNGDLCLYRSGTELAPTYQGLGIYSDVTDLIFAEAFRQRPHQSRLLYCWRTRNAIVALSNARRCAEVVPDLQADPPKENGGRAGLLALAVLAAKRLYPDRVLELPALVMRDVYGHIKHRKPSYKGVAMHVGKRIATLAPNSSDALFSLGIVRRPSLS